MLSWWRGIPEEKDRRVEMYHSIIEMIESNESSLALVRMKV